MDISGFVNDARNKCLFSGYPIGIHDGNLLLRQTQDLTKSIPIRVARNFVPPVPWRAIMVTAHLLVTDGVPYFKYVHHISATIQSMPQKLFWLNSLRGAGKDVDPFDSLEKVRADIRKAMQVDDQVIDSMLKQVEANSRFRKAFTNKIVLSGFVGPKAFKPSEQEGGAGYVHLLLQQYPELEAAIPIDITGVDATFGQRLRAHLPVTVFAKAQMANDAAGTPAIRILSDWKGVAQAPGSAFAGKKWPQWAIDALRKYHEDRIAGVPAQQPALPRAEPPAEPPVADTPEDVPPHAPIDATGAYAEPGVAPAAPGADAQTRADVLAAFGDLDSSAAA